MVRLWCGSSSWFADGHPLAVSLHGEERVSSVLFSYKDTNPIMEAPSS